MQNSESRILLKVQEPAANSLRRRGFATAGVKYDVEPLFRKAAAKSRQRGIASGSEHTWLLARPAQTGHPNAWDAAHAALDESAIIYAEPDVLHEWSSTRPSEKVGMAT